MTHSRPNVDFTAPLSVLLRQTCVAEHEATGHVNERGWLTSGRLSKGEYVRYLMMLYHVYYNLEQGLQKNAAHPAIALVHNSALLARAHKISRDIAVLLEVPGESWHSDDIYYTLMASPPTILTQYIAHLRHLSDADPARLLAHAYVRYMGDLCDGPHIRVQITRAYETQPGYDCASFYKFNQPDGSAEADATDMFRIKNWYSTRLDAAVRDNMALKAALVEETRLALSFKSSLVKASKPPRSGVDDSTPMMPQFQRSTTRSLFSLPVFATGALAVWYLTSIYPGNFDR